VSPTPDAQDVPTDAVIAAQWIDCCVQTTGETPMEERLTIRVEGTSEVITTAATVSGEWGTINDTITRTSRVVPVGGLAPDTNYEVWAEMPSGWTQPFSLIGRFRTGTGPSAGGAPPPPELTPRLEDTRRCGGSGVECCYNNTDQLLRVVGFDGLEGGSLYTIRRTDGTLVGMDLAAPAQGIIMCGYFVGLRRIEDPEWIPWSVEDVGALALLVTQRDIAGRESDPSMVTVDATCPPPPPDGCGCRVGQPRSRGRLGLLVVLLVVVALVRRPSGYYRVAYRSPKP